MVIASNRRPQVSLRTAMTTGTQVQKLKGSVLGVILHDVCEEIRLEELRDILGARRTEPSFKHATPEYVRFENPPVVETLDPIVLGSGESIRPQIKYYDYGVVSVLMEFPFEGDWESRSAPTGTGASLQPLARRYSNLLRASGCRDAPVRARSAPTGCVQLS